LGYSATAAKVAEIKKAIDQGADELDVVVNLSAVKNGAWNYIKNEMQSLTTACHMKGKVIKAIVETGVLTDDELKKIADLCAKCEVDFVKTSTGFNGTGATIEAVSTLRELLPSSIKIKASGGIRDRAFAEELIKAGADRLGCSASIQIVSG
jgi:deoxyribose-phosphate aldolase